MDGNSHLKWSRGNDGTIYMVQDKRTGSGAEGYNIYGYHKNGLC